MLHLTIQIIINIVLFISYVLFYFSVDCRTTALDFGSDRPRLSGASQEAGWADCCFSWSQWKEEEGEICCQSFGAGEEILLEVNVLHFYHPLLTKLDKLIRNSWSF